jgi:hypothetical protein
MTAQACPDDAIIWSHKVVGTLGQVMHWGISRMFKTVVLALAVVSVGAPAQAGPLENTLAKLDPQERSHQACIIKGIDMVRHDARLKNADRIKTQIFAPAVLDNTQLTAKGGAVRAGKHWYAMSFTCQLSKDLAKATAFTFALGKEIPKESWEKHGLWQ